MSCPWRIISTAKHDEKGSGNTGASFEFFRSLTAWEFVGRIWEMVYKQRLLKASSLLTLRLLRFKFQQLCNVSLGWCSDSNVLTLNSFLATEPIALSPMTFLST